MQIPAVAALEPTRPPSGWRGLVCWRGKAWRAVRGWCCSCRTDVRSHSSALQLLISDWHSGTHAEEMSRSSCIPSRNGQSMTLGLGVRTVRCEWSSSASHAADGEGKGKKKQFLLSTRRDLRVQLPHSLVSLAAAGKRRLAGWNFPGRPHAVHDSTSR